MRKLPYIPDKKLYAAVMCTLDHVRETRRLDEAVDAYSHKYDVDPDDIRKYVSIARNGPEPRKYKYYVGIVLNDEIWGGDEGYFSSDMYHWDAAEKARRSVVCVKRALSEHNARMNMADIPNAVVFGERGGKWPKVMRVWEFDGRKSADGFAAGIDTTYLEKFYLES